MINKPNKINLFNQFIFRKEFFFIKIKNILFLSLILHLIVYKMDKNLNHSKSIMALNQL
jgi:hypothetical protein